MAQLVTETYAGALFEVACECDTLDVVAQDFNAIISLFKEEVAFYELYKTPKITNEEKKRIVDTVFLGKVNREILNFLKVLIDKRRTAYLIGIYKAFDTLYKKHLNLAKAIVKSVVPLSERQSDMLAEQLSDLTGKKVSIENTIDKTLVGGLLIQIGDRIIDNSVKRKIVDLKELLIKRVV